MNLLLLLVRKAWIFAQNLLDTFVDNQFFDSVSKQNFGTAILRKSKLSFHRILQMPKRQRCRAVLAVPFLIMAPQLAYAQGLLCSERGAELRYEASLGSSPLFMDLDSFVAFIEENASAFQEGGEAYECSIRFGVAFIELARNSTSGIGAQGRSAKEMFPHLPPGLLHLPDQVDSARLGSSTGNVAGSLYQAGIQAIQAAEVFADAAGDNWEPFVEIFSTVVQERTQLEQHCQMMRQIFQSSPKLCDTDWQREMARKVAQADLDLALATNKAKFEAILNNQMVLLYDELLSATLTLQ